jgi:hypothetical protein
MYFRTRLNIRNSVDNVRFGVSSPRPPHSQGIADQIGNNREPSSNTPPRQSFPLETFNRGMVKQSEDFRA